MTTFHRMITNVALIRRAAVRSSHAWCAGDQVVGSPCRWYSTRVWALISTKSTSPQRPNNHFEVGLEQRQEGYVGDVAGRDH